MTGRARRGGWRAWSPFLALWAVLVTLALVLDDDGSVAGPVIGGGLGTILCVRYLLPARAARHARREQLECGLRVVAGRHPGLGPRWRHGVGTPAPGVLTFRGTIGGVRLLRRAPVPVQVTHIDATRPRTSGVREAWSLLPGSEVIEIVTPTARLEWAGPPERLRWATGRLQPAEEDSPAY